MEERNAPARVRTVDLGDRPDGDDVTIAHRQEGASGASDPVEVRLGGACAPVEGRLQSGPDDPLLRQPVHPDAIELRAQPSAEEAGLLRPDADEPLRGEPVLERRPRGASDPTAGSVPREQSGVPEPSTGDEGHERPVRDGSRYAVSDPTTAGTP